MECPFRELHEFYKIVYDRAEAHAKAEKEREAEEQRQREKEEQAERNRKGLPPQLRRAPPTDAKQIKPDTHSQLLSPYEAESLEEMIEDIAGGGVI